MYDCERCGASFSPLRIASPETCPRCLAREGLRTPLSYSLFSKARPPAEGLEAPSANTAEQAAQRDTAAIG